jgi:formate dehydrogenase assembly factor FdhD
MRMTVSARPLELGRHAEVDVVAGDFVREGARLRGAALAPA